MRWRPRAPEGRVRHRAALVAGCALLLGVSPAGAGGSAPGNVVFDPSNFARNTVSATQSVRAELQRAQQILQQAQAYALQLRQYATMAAQLRSLRPADLAWLVVQSDADLQRMAGYAQAVRTLYGDLGSLRTELDRQFLRKERSGLTWEAYVRREQLAGRLRQAGQEQAFTTARDLMQRVIHSVEQVRTLQERIPASAGTHEAVQLLDAQLGVLVNEQAALMAFLSTRGMAEAQERREQELAAAEHLAAQQAASVRAEAAAGVLQADVRARRARLAEVFPDTGLAP